jgi:hypothetical protein
MNLKLLVSLIFLCHIAQAQQNIIRIDQEGYYPNAPKMAVFVISPGISIDSTAKEIPFYLTGINGMDTVFRGMLSGIRQFAKGILFYTGIHVTGSPICRKMEPGGWSSRRLRDHPSIRCLGKPKRRYCDFHTGRLV